MLYEEKRLFIHEVGAGNKKWGGLGNWNRVSKYDLVRHSFIQNL